jgi:phosphatidylserine/phosphatidylglycerophosphate/cardiolipin synthase-like enzyme
VVAHRLNHAIPLLLALLLIGAPVAADVGIGGPSLPPASAAQLLADEAYYPALLGQIRAARKSIDLVTYLWKISAAINSKPGELVRALGEARRRGVIVRVILENSGYDEELNRANREAAAQLQQEGITATFDAAAVTTHAKMVVIDHRFCLIGSHNLTQSALEKNHEISVMMDNPRLAGELGTYMDRLLGKR